MAQKTTEQIDRELEIKRLQIAKSYDGKTDSALYASLGKLMAASADIGVEKAKSLADFKVKMAKIVGDYQKSRDAGAKGAVARGMVELNKLMVTAPIDYAKAAFLPDKSLLAKINEAAVSPNLQNDDDKKRVAWETYLGEVVPEAGNVLGSWDEMVDKYGEPNISASNDNQRLWESLRRVKDRLALERVEANRFQDGVRFINDTGAAYEKFLSETGKPDNEQTAAEFYDYYNMDVKLPSLGDTAFIATLQKAVNDPKSYTDEASQSIFDETQTTIRADIERLMSERSSGDAEDEKEDDFRDKLAAWVGRPETRWWAEQRGFNIGETYPITPELQKEIDDGKYPGAVYTKYGVYIPRKDDMKALNAALADTKRDPSRNLFRAAGVGQGGGAPVEIEIKEPSGPSSARIVESGGYQDEGGKKGILARLDNGDYVASVDGKVWKPIPRDAGDRLAATTTLTPDEEGIEVPIEARKNTRTVLGIYRRPTYQDSPGSVRYVDTETGKEVYLPPEQVAAVRYPGKQPTEARRPVVAEAVRTAAARRAMTKSGFSPEDVKPTPAVVLTEKEEPRAAVSPPAPSPAPAVSPGMQAYRDVVGGAMLQVAAENKANPAPVTKPPAPVAKSPAPPAEKQEPTVGTTVSPVVTPTAGTDPRKRLYKTVYAQRPE